MLRMQTMTRKTAISSLVMMTLIRVKKKMKLSRIKMDKQIL